ncbi:AbrB/MazE/SpoVT family DNA-binding domain-containing protein [Gracilibacillus marinus]|uniref:AbrB/MazE/SpoVT family DNA-binding domain-containing protein n=1 Tax=Gracilibacillus marinus TaxID=630535 RepID=A0ABV8VS37_9BACI
MTKVQKVGNGLALRIPTCIAKELGIVHGSEVELRVCEGNLIMKLTLEILLSQTKGKTNPHLVYNFGGPTGKEII